jgi:thiol-disulfide isomerase/thioredoxin
MLKYIISLFFFIYFLTGCENKNTYDDIVKKLKEQNTTATIKDIEKNKTIPKQIEIPKETLVNKEEIKPKQEVKNLTLKTLTNENIKLSFQNDGITFENYKDKVVILDIFTTWCPPCIESIPHLNQLQKQYKKDIQIIGIMMEEDKKNSEVLSFKKKYHMTYPVTNSKENFKLVDTWGGVSGYPTIIIFDKKGTYFNHFNGSPPIEMLESDIKKVLRK